MHLALNWVLCSFSILCLFPMNQSQQGIYIPCAFPSQLLVLLDSSGYTRSGTLTLGGHTMRTYLLCLHYEENSEGETKVFLKRPRQASFSFIQAKNIHESDHIQSQERLKELSTQQPQKANHRQRKNMASKTSLIGFK